MNIGRSLYNLVLTLAWPFVVARLYIRGLRSAGYRDGRWQRFGHGLAPLPRGALWIHAVSMGEVAAAAPLVERLLAERPGLEIVLTTMTPAGSAAVTRLLGGKVTHCLAPYDFRSATGRFLDSFAPRLVILIETELWPNMVAESVARDVPVLLVNARMSARSARGYQRAAFITRPMFESLSLVACQYEDHARRFAKLGVDPSRLTTLGNVKFDTELPADLAARQGALRRTWRLDGRPVWIAVSTHEGEEPAVLEAHGRLRAGAKDALLIWAPRHLERTTACARLAEDRGLHVEFVSAARAALVGTDVLIVDTLGDLANLCGLAKIAFIGGSLVPIGGHNPVEAAAQGVSLVTGRFDFNFSEVMAAFEAGGALTRVDSADKLAVVLEDLLNESEGSVAQRALRTRQVVEANRGALERLVAVVLPWIDSDRRIAQ